MWCATTQLLCANGNNLKVGGEGVELKKAKLTIKWKNVVNKLVHHGIQWHHIPPFSPEMVGTGERLVGVSKNLVLSTLASNYFRKISGEELRTFFKEVQCILNWRPLTPVSSDLHEYRTISSISIM